MTLGIAIRTRSGVVLAADTLVTSGNLTVETTGKLVEHRQCNLLAVAGRAGIGQRVQEGWLRSKRGTLEDLKATLRAHCVSSDEDSQQIECLFASSADIVVVDWRGMVTRSRYPFMTIGSGCEVATGFLGALIDAKKLPGKSEALAIAARCMTLVADCVPTVGGPFQYRTRDAKR
jgi:20S proteasome alpha/beta subunit